MTLRKELKERIHLRLRKPIKDPAKKILFDVFCDIMGRQGFYELWDSISAEQKEHILFENLQIIEMDLPKP